MAPRQHNPDYSLSQSDIKAACRFISQHRDLFYAPLQADSPQAALQQSPPNVTPPTTTTKVNEDTADAEPTPAADAMGM